MDAGGIIVGFFIGFLASLFANSFSPAFNRRVNFISSYISSRFDPERFDLTGKWVQTFSEPKAENPEEREDEEEIVTLAHIGNRISGNGHTQKLHRIFSYDLRVSHNMVLGVYSKKGEKGNLTGRGLCQMIVSPDRLQMEGQATWYDRDSKRIESSEIIWKKHTL